MTDKVAAVQSGFETIALVTYMGVEQPVGLGAGEGGKPAFYRLDASSAITAPLNFEPSPDTDPLDRQLAVDALIHRAMDKYRHHIRVEARSGFEGTNDAFAAYFGDHEINWYQSRESALLGARDDAFAYVPEDKLIQTLISFEQLGERFEIAGDATTDNHYLALATQYGANMVRRPDPAAAKADIIRQFGEKAVELGVPQEREGEAGANMFASMVRVSAKLAAERDRDLRRSHIPVLKRGEPDAELVQWLDAMPENVRRGVIANNVRGYVPLYQPDPLQESEIRSSAVSQDLETLKAAILQGLDGDSVLAFEDFKAFQEWFDVTHAYEKQDAGAEDVSPALLQSAFGELRTAETVATSGRDRDVAVIDIASTDTAAFEDIGRFTEAARIFTEVADSLADGVPASPVALYDTNGNVVGSFAMRADQPPQSAAANGSIQLALNTRLLGGQDKAQAMSAAIREAGSRLSQQTAADVMFLVTAADGTTLGSVAVNAPRPVELVRDNQIDSLSL